MISPISSITTPHFMRSLVDISTICESLLDLINQSLKSSIQFSGKKLEELHRQKAILIEEYAKATTSASKISWLESALKYLAVASGIYFGVSVRNQRPMILPVALGIGAVAGTLDIAAHVEASRKFASWATKTREAQLEVEDKINFAIKVIDFINTAAASILTWRAGGGDQVMQVFRLLQQFGPQYFATQRMLEETRAASIRSKTIRLDANLTKATNDLKNSQKQVQETADVAKFILESSSRHVQQYIQMGA